LIAAARKKGGFKANKRKGEEKDAETMKKKVEGRKCLKGDTKRRLCSHEGVYVIGIERQWAAQASTKKSARTRRWWGGKKKR